MNDIARATSRRDIFRYFYNLVSGFNITGGYTVVSSFPESNTTYPILVIDPASVSEEVVGMRPSTRDNDCSVLFTFFDLAKNHKSSVDNAVDDFINQLYNSDAALVTGGFSIINHIDLPVTTQVIREQVVNKRVVDFNLKVLYHG